MKEALSNTEELQSYNAELFAAYKGGNRAALLELLTCNENMFYHLMKTSCKIWRIYPMATSNEVQLIIKGAFLQVIQSDEFQVWDNKIWNSVVYVAKRQIHEEFRSGGITRGLSTQYRKYAENEDSYTICDEESMYNVSDNSNASNPELHLLNRDRCDAVHSIMEEANLSRLEETVINLHYQEDLKLTEIAKRLSLSNANARKIHSRALKKLKAASGLLFTEDDAEYLLS